MNAPGTPAEERAYYAIPDSDESTDAYVCWDCATADERTEAVDDSDAMGESCARCEVFWVPVEWETADSATSPRSGLRTEDER